MDLDILFTVFHHSATYPVTTTFSNIPGQYPVVQLINNIKLSHNFITI